MSSVNMCRCICVHLADVYQRLDHKKTIGEFSRPCFDYVNILLQVEAYLLVLSALHTMIIYM